jgi:DNA polymerase-3 subunit gamma/tau
MFENLVAQPAADQLVEDIRSSALPSSLLFQGPSASGKGTAALELARVLSCENPQAPWNCTCSACTLHRTLSHPDLLLLGSRPFSSEISASAAAFVRESESSARLLFLRSLKKLTARFASTLWEGEEAKLNKAAALVVTINEMIEDLENLFESPTVSQSLIPRLKETTNPEDLVNLVEKIKNTAIKLEADGIGDTIPISQVRRASYWARLAPVGKRKLLVLENADRMQDSARNALLKILEEPPETSVVVLTTERRGAILPTILSRLRPYQFSRRESAKELEVIRRVFRDNAGAEALGATADPWGSSKITAYLESFLPISPALINQAAAFFAHSIFNNASYGAEIKEKFFQNPSKSDFSADSREVVGRVLKMMDNFTIRSLFPLFLERVLRNVEPLLREPLLGAPMAVVADQWRQAIRTADVAVGTYNQNPSLALEALFIRLTEKNGV